MSKANNTPLFDAFPVVTKAQWLEKVHQDLKGRNFEETLVWETEEGFALQPFYTSEDTNPEALLQLYPGPEGAVVGARHWQYCQHIVVGANMQEANTVALQALNNGAEAICFDLTTAPTLPDWPALFREFQWAYFAIAIRLLPEQTDWLANLASYWAMLDLPQDSVNGFVLTDSNPVGDAWQAHTRGLERFRGLALRHPAEALLTSEKVGALLVALHAQIEAHGTAAAGNACFHYALDSNYFFQIAGLRALRFLSERMLRAYEDTTHRPIPIHAYTTPKVSETTQQHPEWNMLSNTTEAMSGILGGCQYLSILPHTEGLAPTDAFATRIARNVSNILREESYLDKVADPVAGSYYLEHLTDQLAERAWAYFQAQLPA